MTSVGNKLTLKFGRYKSSKKRSIDPKDLDSERSSVYSVYRKNSVGALSSIKTTKSSPIASVTRSENPDNQLGHDDIISLTHDVRSFSEALAKLKTVFERTRLEPSVGEDFNDVRVAAHEKLGEVLCIIKMVLQKYPALHTTDVLTTAAILITKIKSCSYDKGSDLSDLHYSVDQLALAFSSSVSEYLMGDIDSFPQLSKTKSYENLLSEDNDIMGQQDTSKDSASLLGTTENMDAVLLQTEYGVELALKKAKAWSKYAKEIIVYVEKRASLECEYTKSLAKLASGIRRTLSEDVSNFISYLY